MTGHLGSKFGVPPEDAVEVIRRARDAGLEMLGLHVHLGSQLVDDAPARCGVEWLGGFVCRATGGARLDAADRRTWAAVSGSATRWRTRRRRDRRSTPRP